MRKRAAKFRVEHTTLDGERVVVELIEFKLDKYIKELQDAGINSIGVFPDHRELDIRYGKIRT